MALTIDRVKVRAEITFCDITISTPDILSFNVRRARGQASADFSASLKIPHHLLASADTGYSANVIIRAGEEGLLRTIFTGYVYKININPSRTDSSYAIVNISGKDILSVMDGQNITRRVPVQQLAKWGAITSILSKRDKFKERFPLKIRDDQARVTWTQMHEFQDFVVGSPDPNASIISTTGATNTSGQHDVTMQSSQ